MAEEEPSFENRELIREFSSVQVTKDLPNSSKVNGNYSNRHNEKFYKSSQVATNSHPLIEECPKIKYTLNKENSFDQISFKDFDPISSTKVDLSDNETDKSIYEARVSSNYQDVAMIMNEKEGNLNFLAYGKKSNKLRRIKCDVEPQTDSEIESDLSSLDSSPDLLKSEDVYLPSKQDNTGDDDVFNAIVPLSEDEEHKHSRYWQHVMLPNGERQSIDMRVIEPYKRVLSHGGYLRTGGQTALILFSACFLPDKSRCDYDYVMDNLFLYVLWTLDRLITEDYILIYMNGGASRLPSFNWIKRCYQLVGRKLRKNLCHMYFVHPTLWIRTMLFMARPFISSKFFRKISFAPNLKELKRRVPVELTAIPDKISAYPLRHSRAVASNNGGIVMLVFTGIL